MDMVVTAVGSPSFVPGLVAVINLFGECPPNFTFIPVLLTTEPAGFGSTPTFMPVIAEMKAPKQFTKSLFTSQGFLAACYISFGVVVYV